jgi:hypothetical protein
MADLLERGSGLFRNGRQFVAAGKAALATGDAARYDRLSRNVLSQAESLRRAFRAFPTGKVAEERVADVYEDERAARVLVSAVNGSYPEGYLAGRFGGGE